MIVWPRPGSIQSIVKRSGLSLRLLAGPRGTADMTRARFAVIAAARRRGHSSPKIGRILHRHHSSILAGAQRANEIAAADPSFAKLIEELSA